MSNKVPLDRIEFHEDWRGRARLNYRNNFEIFVKRAIQKIIKNPQLVRIIEISTKKERQQTIGLAENNGLIIKNSKSFRYCESGYAYDIILSATKEMRQQPLLRKKLVLKILSAILINDIAKIVARFV